MCLALQRDIRLQARFSAALSKRDLDTGVVDGEVFGNNGNNLVFEGLQELWRDLGAVVDEDELKPFFG
jgi:hypothetical protein